jgi:hypothetical protein
VCVQLEEEEISELAKRLGSKLTRAQLLQAMAEMDGDGGGGVDFGEFYAWFASVSPEGEGVSIACVDTPSCRNTRGVYGVPYLTGRGVCGVQDADSVMSKDFSMMDDRGAPVIEIHPYDEEEEVTKYEVDFPEWLEPQLMPGSTAA